MGENVDVPAVERALLTGKWNEEVGPSDLPVLAVARNVVNGDFRDLTLSPSRDLFTVTQSANDVLARPLAEWFEHARPPTDSPERELLRLTAAVACLHAFLQANWTGPDLGFDALDVLVLTPELAALVTDDVLHHKAVSELAHAGEPAYHLAKQPAFLQLARILLEAPFQHCQSAPWWRLRTWRIHEQVLDDPVAVPPELTAALSPLLETFASEPDVCGRLLLEQGLLEHYVGNDKSAADFFLRAARATQLEYELSGALGKRTKFQVHDVTQLVLLARSRSRGDGSDPRPTTNDTGSDPSGDHDQATTGTSETPDPAADTVPPVPSATVAVPETLALNDDTLLERTAYTSSSSASATASTPLAQLDPAAQPPLHPLDQSILLALCLNVKNTSPAHGLTAEQMTPYVARVLAHPANWSVHTMALLLRSRLEAARTRTAERAVLQLQALVDQMPTADAPPAERLLYVHALVLPPRWELERELAARLRTVGAVKSALDVFERLEMWEDAVQCWAGIERADRGSAVVRDLLAGRKAEADAVLLQGKAALSPARRRVLDAARTAKLWCLLGDLEPAHAREHYTQAWEVSGQASGRAMRSLGGHHFTRGEYPEAVTCLRRAVAISPLLSQTWFLLGCACLRVEDWDGAREAFSRCVAIDDDDGESWNNLASVYMRMGEAGKKIALEDGKEDDPGSDGRQQTANAAREDTEKRIPFSNKLLAFRALKHGLRSSYDNWRMWINYMIIAMDVGELSEACRALARVVEERAAKDGIASVDEDVVDRLVDAATRELGENRSGDSNNIAVDAHAQTTQSTGIERRVVDLLERTILPRVSSPRIFRARARLLTAQGRYKDALDAYLDAYRAGPAGTMEKGETDVEQWRTAVNEVEEIVDVLRNYGPRHDEGFNWKLQARSIVRSFMGRTKDFEDEPEWAKLAALQEEIKKGE